MFYINLKDNQPPIKQKDLLKAAMIPSQQRTNKDHQIIYKYFIDNYMLMQLERTKSLNARIKCVAGMILVKKVDYNPAKHIIMHQFEDMRAIVLPVDVKEEAEKYDEHIIRKKLDRLKVFSVVKMLKYDALLYLCYHVEDQICKFKDYLYKEGSEPEYVYFLEEGQFCFIKDSGQIEHQGLGQSTKGKSRKGMLKSMEKKEQSPNKSITKKTKRYQIGIVQGKLGQTIGLQQIAIRQYSQGRRYTVLCNSTENKLLKIHKKYFQTLFQEIPSFCTKVLKQVSNTVEAKNHFYDRIQTTKKNMKQYIQKTIDLSEVKQEEQQVQKSSTVALNISMSRYKLPIIDRKSVHIEKRSKNFSEAVDSSQKQRQSSIKKTLKSESNFEIQNASEQDLEEQGFGITNIREPPALRHSKTKVSQDSFKQSLESEKALQLPIISNKDTGRDRYKSFSFKRTQASQQGLPRSRSRLRQYAGMMDPGKLIEQKMQILDKKITHKTRAQLFPFGHVQYKQTKKIHLEDPMKLKASPAHSHRFMENMLLKALKKAGYDEEHEIEEPVKRQSKTNSIRPAQHAQFFRNLQNKTKKKHLDEKSDSLLVNSAFDECYFGKID